MQQLISQTYSRSRFVIIILATFLALSPLMLSTVQLALADSVIATIEVGESPTEIAFNPINGSMYIVDTGLVFTNGGVSVIDGRTNKFLTNINISGPGNVAFNPNNNDIYVTNSTDVTVIGAKDNRVIKTLPMRVNGTIPSTVIPNAIAYNAKNGDMYLPANVLIGRGVRNSCTRNVIITCVVSVIDSKSNEIIKNIPIGKQGDPSATSAGIIAFDPNNSNMYVGNYRDRSISIINSSNQVVTTIPLSGSPSAIAYNPKNGNMYVAGGASNVVSVIDSKTNKVIKSIPGVGIFPDAIAYNPKNGNMYVAGGASKSVFAIDSKYNNITKTIPLGGGPNAIQNAIAYNPKNGNMYVTIGFDNLVKVIDSISNKVVDTFPVRQGAFKIALDPINNDMYVTNSLNNTVSVIGAQ
jgi:YVTN family beta-propeller protein